MDEVIEFANSVNNLLNNNEYQEAKSIISRKLDIISPEENNYLYFLAEIAGIYIDIGCETSDKESINKGVSILESSKEALASITTRQSFFYCLANGKSGLFKFDNVNHSRPSLEIVKPNLLDSKNYYFKAFKDINHLNLTNLDLMILTNLGNTLSQFGRVIDAIKYFDQVVRFNLNFTEALIGYSEALDYWIRISGCPQPISLYSKIYYMLNLAIENGNISKYYLNTVEVKTKFYKDLLDDDKFNTERIVEEFKLNEKEYQQHSHFRKFCIDNYLTLSEHGVYCNCVGASIDNLSIGYEGIVLTGNKVFKLELLLNRLKSEFHNARKLYYEGTNNPKLNTEVLYFDLQEEENISETTEDIRISFRLCFGLLDKIAHGICYLLDLNKSKKEHIYFESFWNHPSNPKRWDRLKDNKNPHLLSLSGLSYKNGQVAVGPTFVVATLQNHDYYCLPG